MNDDLKDEIETLESIYNDDELKITYRSNSTQISYTTQLDTSTAINISFVINNDHPTVISVTNTANTVKSIPNDILDRIHDVLAVQYEEEIDSMPVFQCISFCNDELLHDEELNLVEELKGIKPIQNKKDIERAFWSEVDKYRKEFKLNGGSFNKYNFYKYSFGDRVRVKNVKCDGTVRYIGTPLHKNGIWYGIELDEAKGKNNGIIKNKTYFKCNQNCGIFVSSDNIENIVINNILMNVDAVINDKSMNDVDLEDIKESDFKTSDTSEYVMDYKHVNIEVKEFSDIMEVDGKMYNGGALVKVFGKINVKQEELSLWGGYFGNQLFQNTEDAQNRLKNVIDFAENNTACSKHIKLKLRVITKLIINKGIGKSCEYVHILLLLASHGNVCNVMKEVAIGNAYGLMTDKLNDFVKQQSLEQQIYKVLRDYRVLLVEELFHAFGMNNNTHYIAGFHNVLAKDIGVTPYNDPDICPPSSDRCKNWRNGLDKRYFKTLYTKDNIVKHLFEQIKEKKIGYQNVVKYMEENCPENVHKIAFLQQAINIDTGDIHERYMCWILQKLGVFMIFLCVFIIYEYCFLVLYGKITNVASS